MPGRMTDWTVLYNYIPVGKSVCIKKDFCTPLIKSIVLKGLQYKVLMPKK